MSVIIKDRTRIVISTPGPQGAAGSGSGSGTVTSITAGAGLTGGTITTSGTLAVSYGSAANTACQGNDSRLSDARTPTSHSHVAADIGSVLGPGLVGRSAASSGTCERIGLGTGLEIDASKNLTLSTTPAAQTVQMIAGTGLTGGGTLAADRTFNVSYGTTAGTACAGNDSRLSDARTPTSHTHTLSDLAQSSASVNQVATWNGTAWVASSPSGTGTVTGVTAGAGLTGGTITTSGTLAVSYGTTANTACQGNDSRLSDSRAPTEHTHYAPQQYVGHIETPTARTYYIDLYAPALTITSLRFKTTAGTVDVTVFNGASQVYTADGLGTTRTDVTSGLTNTSVSAGGTISLVVDAVSSPADLQFVVAYTASTGGVE